MGAVARRSPASEEPQGTTRFLPEDNSFPVLQKLLEGPQGADALAELERLVRAKSRSATARAPRLRRNLFARLRLIEGDLCEIGVVRDISRTGARVKFLRSASLDIIRNEQVILETRLPCNKMVTLEARMVRVASSTQQHIELAFHFTEAMADNQGLLALLSVLEQE